MGFRRLEKHLTQEHLNQLFDATERQNILQTGRGVLQGCMIEPVPCALQVIVREGIIQAEATKWIPEDLDVPLPAYATRYVWRDENGRTLLTETPDLPGGMFVCVGRVVTGGEAVLQVDGEGRMEPPRVQPDDPHSWVFRGEVLPKGPLHNPVAEQFLDGDLSLSPTDRNVQILDPGAFDRIVTLFASPHWGNWFRIVNNGEGDDGDITVQVEGGGVLGVLEPGDVIDVAVKASKPARATKKARTAKQKQAPTASARRDAKKGRRDRTEWFVQGMK